MGVAPDIRRTLAGPSPGITFALPAAPPPSAGPSIVSLAADYPENSEESPFRNGPGAPHILAVVCKPLYHSTLHSDARSAFRISASHPNPAWHPKPSSLWPPVPPTLPPTVPRATPEPPRSTLDLDRGCYGEAPMGLRRAGTEARLGFGAQQLPLKHRWLRMHPVEKLIIPGTHFERIKATNHLAGYLPGDAPDRSLHFIQPCHIMIVTLNPLSRSVLAREPVKRRVIGRNDKTDCHAFCPKPLQKPFQQSNHLRGHGVFGKSHGLLDGCRHVGRRAFAKCRVIGNRAVAPTHQFHQAVPPRLEEEYPRPRRSCREQPLPAVDPGDSVARRGALRGADRGRRRQFPVSLDFRERRGRPLPILLPVTAVQQPCIHPNHHALGPPAAPPIQLPERDLVLQHRAAHGVVEELFAGEILAPQLHAPARTQHPPVGTPGKPANDLVVEDAVVKDHKPVAEGHVPTLHVPAGDGGLHQAHTRAKCSSTFTMAVAMSRASGAPKFSLKSRLNDASRTATALGVLKPSAQYGLA